MKKNLVTASLCADFLGLKLIGEDIVINRAANFDEVCNGAIKFISKYSSEFVEIINSTGINFVIATMEYAGKLKIPHVISMNPRLDFCKVINHFFPLKREPKIEPTAVIGKNVKIGKNVYIGQYTIIEDNVEIGDNTVILHHVVIGAKTIIGSNCLIKSGAVIGEKGFGFERDKDETPIPFPHFGRVIIGNNVEVGALSTIAAGGLSDTVVEDFVKIDDHVHIAHNVKIGEKTLIVACAEISGSVSIGENVWIAPNSSIIDKIKIGNRAFIGLGAVVIDDVPDAVVVVGNPGKILRRLSDEKEK